MLVQCFVNRKLCTILGRYLFLFRISFAALLLSKLLNQFLKPSSSLFYQTTLLRLILAWYAGLTTEKLCIKYLPTRTYWVRTLMRSSKVISVSIFFLKFIFTQKGIPFRQVFWFENSSRTSSFLNRYHLTLCNLDRKSLTNELKRIPILGTYLKGFFTALQ